MGLLVKLGLGIESSEASQQPQEKAMPNPQQESEFQQRSMESQENTTESSQETEQTGEIDKKDGESQAEKSRRELANLKKYGERNVKDGLSVLPVVAANSTFGVMAGGAAIYHKPLQKYHDLLAAVILTTKGQKLLNSKYKAKGRPNTFGLDLELTDFFIPYYDDSKEARREEANEIQIIRHEIRPSWTWSFGNGDLRLTGYFMEKYRKERGKLLLYNGDTESRKIYPDERSRVVGAVLAHDTRKENNHSQQGAYRSLEISHNPGGRHFTSLEEIDGFTKYELDLRHYHLLTPDYTLAGRVAYGDSTGKLPQTFVYTLGGSVALRGFGERRFPGEKYYVVQTEFRYHIWRQLSGNTFVEFGDCDEEKLDETIWSYGTGFKIGLPPDYVAKLRLDFGFSRDGMNVTAMAFHAF